MGMFLAVISTLVGFSLAYLYVKDKICNSAFIISVCFVLITILSNGFGICRYEKSPEYLQYKTRIMKEKIDIQEQKLQIMIEKE